MNLAIRGIEGRSPTATASTTTDHPDLKADFISSPTRPSTSPTGVASGSRTTSGGNTASRPVGNANFAWVQHIVHHLAPAGMAGFVPADELAFYDALGINDSAVQVLGDDTLRDIARELVETVRGNVTIDWRLRENVRANLRRLVKRILRKHGYPPDKQEKATRTVLEQAEVLSAGWAA